MKNIIGLVLGCLFLVSNSAAADFGLGVRAGTLGAGLDLSLALTKTINARITLASIDEQINETVTIDDNNSTAEIDAELDLGFGAAALLFDWYVFDGKFHLTAGLMRNDAAVDINGRLVGATATFDGTTYSVGANPGDITPVIGGTISAGQDFEPYLGIGWGRKAGQDVGFDFTFELGVMMTSPEADLRATAVSPADQAQLDQDIQAAEKAANDDLSVLEAWPVITIGLNYAF